MKRPIRLLAAWLALFAVLLSQLAVAAYACPFEALATEAAVAVHVGCDGANLDEEQPALCHAHGQQGDQSLDKPLVSIPQPALLQGLVSDWGPESGPAPGIPGELRSLLARATTPPVALRNCCLRI